MPSHCFLFDRIFRFYWQKLKTLFKKGTDLNVVMLLNLLKNDYQKTNKTITKQQSTLIWNASFFYFRLFHLTFKNKHLALPRWTKADTAQKMKFFIKDSSSKFDQSCSFLQIWSHLLKKSLMENFIFCAVWS